MINYYTYSVESKTLAKAPRVIVRDGKTIILGQPEDFARYLNAYPAAAYEPPTPIEGKTAVPNGYELRNGEWHQTWDYIDNPPPPPRRWTRLSIKTALAQAGMLDAARQYLSTTEIATGYTAWEALTDCDYIEEGYPNAEAWSALLDGAAVALGKTREEIDAFLANIPTEV